MNTEKDIRMKDGTVVPKGTPAAFEPGKPQLCIVHAANRDYRVRPQAAFQAPSVEEIEKAVHDGTCMSVAGYTVEPDGWDEKGSPSWLLALGLI